MKLTPTLPTDTNGIGIGRRTALKKIGGAIAAATTASVAGCAEASNPSGENAESVAFNHNVPTALNPDVYADRFGRVVDLVEDYGADPTGEEPINEQLSRAWDGDTLIVLPQGEYKMTRKFRRTGNEKGGIIGQNAVIRHGRVDAIHGHAVQEGEYSGSTMMFRMGTASNPYRGELVFGGMLFDWTDKNAGMQGINAHVDGRFEIRNIGFQGIHSLGTHGNIRAASASRESFGIVSNISMPFGGVHHAETINTRETTDYAGGKDELGRGQSWSVSGVTGHPEASGTTVFENIICGAWPDNGIYIRGGDGRLIVRRCQAANSGVSQFRINGSDNWEPVEELDGTTDKNEALEGPYGTSVIENSVAEAHTKPDDVTLSQRGIRARSGEVTVRNCEVRIAIEPEASGAGGPFAIGSVNDDGAGGGRTQLTVENCGIYLENEGQALYASGSTDHQATNVVINTGDSWNPTRGKVITGPVDTSDVTLNGNPL